jgi:hypothetical protein
VSCACALMAIALSLSVSSQAVVDVPAPDSLSVLRPVARRPVPPGPGPWIVSQDTTKRAKAVVVSDWYVRRLTIHRYGSYVMLPLFVAQFLLGQELLAQKEGVWDGTRREPIDADLRSAHKAVAIGVGSLFVVNTTTGLWNLWEIRNDGGSTRRTLHVLSMLGADAGFVAVGIMGSNAVEGNPADARAHRNVALASMGLATIGVSLMWF